MDRRSTDDLRPARGCALGVLLGAALWFLVGLSVGLLIRLLR